MLRSPLLALVSLLLGAAEPGDGWSRFLGPGGQGVALDRSPLPEELAPERNLRWQADVEPGLSSPCLLGGRVFLTSARGRALSTNGFDAADGRLRWRRTVEAPELERTHELNGPASPSPTAGDGRVHAYFGSFGLVTYDLDGEELWRRELGPLPNTFGTASSPVLADGTLYLLVDSNGASFLEALDPATGATRWRVERDGFGSGWSTPVPWERGEARELLVYGVLWLTAYDADTGERRWAVPGLADEPIVTPTIGPAGSGGAGLVYVSSYNMRTNPEVVGLPSFDELLAAHDRDGDGELDRDEAAENASVLSRHDADGEGDHPLRIFFRFLDADRDGRLDAAEYGGLARWLATFEHANGLVAIEPGDGEREPRIAWSFERGVPECPSPLLYGERVWLVKNGGLVTCLDARTGAPRFEGRLGARGPYYASPVAGDGKVYAASARGVVTVLAAADELRVLSRSDLGERVMATPALAGGVVYVRTERRLLAFGEGAAGER